MSMPLKSIEASFVVPISLREEDRAGVSEEGIPVRFEAL
ncbi:hypothetical protein DB30_02498 [Enhygromyxa salina]|uniref:Uncharacterized protein n=1 Tax=Enhygromyxa salina TaxID=215803 RepID=A0A0C2D8B0_9BACT|nr:hypothetical protein DB30_02498 [Enhygromyxa salina]